MVKKENILVIFNPTSGITSKELATAFIFKKLKSHFDTVSIINTSSPEKSQYIAKDALGKFDIITAFGGDGTINSIASVLIGSETTLGLLPGGSGNGLVRNLNIPIYWRRALNVLIEGTDVKMDVGQINDRFFLNIAGIGLDGIIAKRYNQQARIRGIVPYIYFGLREYREMPTFRVKIKFEETEFEDEFMILAFANCQQYGGKFIIAPFASPYDTHLDLCILKPFRLLEETVNLQRFFTGNIHKFPFYKSYKFDSLEVESLGEAIPFNFDGEYGGDLSHIKIKVLPRQLKVRVPTLSSQSQTG